MVKWGLAGRALLLVLVIAAIGLGVLIAADRAVSMKAVAERVVEASARGQLGKGRAQEQAFGFTQSYFSECVALSAAASERVGQPDFTIRSRVVLWIPDSNVCDSAVAAAGGDQTLRWYDYSRYWHGYRAILFPIVESAGWRGAQAACGAILMVALCGWFVLLIGVVGWAGSLAGFAVLVALSGLPLTYVTPTHAVSLAVLMGCSGAMLVAAAGGRGREALLVTGVGLGAVYNFFDFFYNPGSLAMMVGGSYLLARGRTRDLGKGDAALAAALAVSALSGYGAMWAIKWLIGMPGYLFGTADFPILPADFTRWAAPSAATYRPFAAIGHMVSAMRGHVATDVVVSSALVMVAASSWARPRRVWRMVWTMAAPVAVGLATIEAVATHSITHGPFTFRIIPFAVTLMVLSAAQGASMPRGAGQANVRPWWRPERGGGRWRRPPGGGQRDGGLLGQKGTGEPLAVETVEAVGGRVEAVGLAVAGDDADGLAVDLDDVGVELERSGHDVTRRWTRLPFSIST